MSRIEHIRGQTFHGRRGDLTNAFRYGVDYVLLDPEASETGPWLFSRNRGNLASLHDTDHGGAPGDGRGAAWIRELMAEQGLDHVANGQVLLLAQPRIFGHVFNPVSFWLVHGADGTLRVVVPEVTNTYGDRHSYLCHHDDLRPIQREDTLSARKILHVSPFLEIEGGYAFRFDIGPEQVGIWIDYQSGNKGLLATLTGKREPLTTASLLGACLRRPFGSRRVLGLIHWQALKLWWKGATFHARPEPPRDEVTR